MLTFFAGRSQSCEPRRCPCGPFKRGAADTGAAETTLYHRVPYRVCLHSRESEAVTKVKQSPVLKIKVVIVRRTSRIRDDTVLAHQVVQYCLPALKGPVALLKFVFFNVT